MYEAHTTLTQLGNCHLQGYRVKIGQILELNRVTRVGKFGKAVTLIFVLEQGYVCWNVGRILGYLLF